MEFSNNRVPSRRFLLTWRESFGTVSLRPLTEIARVCQQVWISVPEYKMPSIKYFTGIKADCEDGVYVTGFMGSNKGFVRKYSSDGGEIWTKADFLDQITEVVYDPREDVLVLTLSTENIMMVTNQGQVLKTINLKVDQLAWDMLSDSSMLCARPER